VSKEAIAIAENAIPLHLSLIRDPELDDNTLYCLRTAHIQLYLRSGHLDCFPVIFQNLWETYGMTFTDKSLLYGALLWIVNRRQRQSWSASERIVDCTLHSRFYNSMSMAIRQNTISECHFFALFFAIFSTTDHEVKRIHLGGLLAIVKLLNERYDSGLESHLQPLRYLYHYVLSFIRRHFVYDVCNPTQLGVTLYIATETLPDPGTTPDIRVIPRGSPADLVGLPGGTGCCAIRWSLGNDNQALMATYTTFALTNSVTAASQLTTTLSSIRSNLEAIQAFPEMSTMFESVRSIKEFLIDDRWILDNRITFLRL
jgi:hypothetical protein